MCFFVFAFVQVPRVRVKCCADACCSHGVCSQSFCGGFRNPHARALVPEPSAELAQHLHSFLRFVSAAASSTAAPPSFVPSHCAAAWGEWMRERMLDRSVHASQRELAQALQQREDSERALQQATAKMHECAAAAAVKEERRVVCASCPCNSPSRSRRPAVWKACSACCVPPMSIWQMFG